MLLWKCYLQELIVTLVIIDQMKCFGYGFKGEYLRILMMQFASKKIELLQFYNQIEYTYKYVQNSVYFYMLLLGIFCS